MRRVDQSFVILCIGGGFCLYLACKNEAPSGPPGSAVNSPTQSPYSYGSGNSNNGYNPSPYSYNPSPYSYGSGSSNFNGTWQTNCSREGSGHSSQQQWQIQGTQFNYTLRLFVDTNCAQADLTQTRSGTFSTSSSDSNSFNNNNGGSTQKVNITLQSEQTMIQSASRAQAWNSANFCQSSNWNYNANYDTLHCEDGPQIYDLWQVNGNQMVQGLFDNSHGGSSDSARPVAVDSSIIFQKN